jgi:hypothetical protein
MKHLIQRNKIFQLLNNLPRGRICIKASPLKPKDTEDYSNELEQADYYRQLN